MTRFAITVSLKTQRERKAKENGLFQPEGQLVFERLSLSMNRHRIFIRTVLPHPLPSPAGSTRVWRRIVVRWLEIPGGSIGSGVQCGENRFGELSPGLE